MPEGNRHPGGSNPSPADRNAHTRNPKPPASMNPLVNGIPSHQIDIADRGFQYGDGIFTTLAVLQGIPLFLPRHLARLQGDCARLALPFPGADCLRREAEILCHGQDSGVLKIQLTRGSGGRGYRCPESPTGTRVLGFHPAPDYPPQLAEHGVHIRFCTTRLGINPALAGIKHCNRLEQILARAEWDDPEIREGLMLDQEGCVVEGTMSNLFLVRQNRLATPRIDRCGVAGVMRGLVCEAAADLGRVLAETRLIPDDVYDADEIFLTNSMLGVWPVCNLDGHEFSVGTVTREIRQWLAQRTQRELSAGCNA